MSIKRAIRPVQPDDDFQPATPPRKRPISPTWSPTMQNQNTPAWVTFTYISFGSAAAMLALGIWALPADP